jgi:hypothetical protein
MTPSAVLAQSLALPNGVVIKNRLVKSAMSFRADMLRAGKKKHSSTKLRTS